MTGSRRPRYCTVGACSSVKRCQLSWSTHSLYVRPVQYRTVLFLFPFPLFLSKKPRNREVVGPQSESGRRVSALYVCVQYSSRAVLASYLAYRATFILVRCLTYRVQDSTTLHILNLISTTVLPTVCTWNARFEMLRRYAECLLLHFYLI